MACKLFENVDSLLKGPKDNRQTVSVSSLEVEGNVLGLYFSAHWCGPCRGFTPSLAKWYTELTSGKLQGKLNIVFVSSDRDEPSFDDYFKDMPWLALPFEQRDLKTKLSKAFKVQGIPTLVFVDAKTGEVLTKNGREVVSNDPNGDEFPWRTPTLNEVLTDDAVFVNKDNTEKKFSEMRGKPLAIYFSAHWCPPCRQFTPKLAEFYKKHAPGKLELIFVSGDRSEEDFKGYLDEMPWYAVPYNNKKMNKQLNTIFEVEGIPCLVILDENLKITTDSGRGMVERDPDALDFPWAPKALDALHSGTASYINERKCLVYAKGKDQGKDDVFKAMSVTAEEYFTKNKDNKESIAFLYTDGDELDEQLLGFLSIKVDSSPVLFMVDIPNGVKYINEGDINVNEFVKKCEKGEVPSKKLQE